MCFTALARHRIEYLLSKVVDYAFACDAVLAQYFVGRRDAATDQAMIIIEKNLTILAFQDAPETHYLIERGQDSAAGVLMMDGIPNHHHDSFFS